MMDWDGHGSGWVVGMTLMMIVFWGSIVALIWVGVRALSQRPSALEPTGRVEPRDILADRLARGEIEPEEFQRRVELLSAKR